MKCNFWCRITWLGCLGWSNWSMCLLYAGIFTKKTGLFLEWNKKGDWNERDYMLQSLSIFQHFLTEMKPVIVNRSYFLSLPNCMDGGHIFHRKFNISSYSNGTFFFIICCVLQSFCEYSKILCFHKKIFLFQIFASI